MDSVPSVVEIIIGLILLWAGVSRIELETLPKAVISIAETAMLIIGVWKLGTLGFALALVVGLVATMAWSLRMAMERQTILTSAAINSREQVTRAEMEALDRRLRRLDGFKAVAPLVQAKLISRLSEQARSIAEIEAMAPVVAMLAQIYKADMIELAPKFDRILRLYAKSPEQSLEVADRLTATTK